MLVSHLKLDISHKPKFIVGTASAFVCALVVRCLLALIASTFDFCLVKVSIYKIFHFSQ